MPREARRVVSTQSKPAPALAEILQEVGRRELKFGISTDSLLSSVEEYEELR